MLEDRLTPADLTWLGVSPSNFMNAANWFNSSYGTFQAPTADDDLYFVGPQLPPPSGSYPLPQVSGLNPNADATIPDSLLTLKSVHLVSNYTGTVSTLDNQHLGTLELQTGDIAQLGAVDGVNDLVITAFLSYTGGTLNSTGYAGTVHITGQSTQFLNIPAIANIGGETLPTLSIGSTVAVEGLGDSVASLYLNGGVFEFFNGGSVYIAEKGFGQSGPIGAIAGAAIPNELRAVGNVASSTGVLTVKGEFVVAKKSPFKATAIIVNHEFAKVVIHDSVTLTAANSVAFDLQAGDVLVEGGIHINLDPTSALGIFGGSFRTYSTVNGEVTINGNFRQEGGTLQLGISSFVESMHVTGKVELNGGSFVAADVDTITGKCDQLSCIGTMRIGANYTYVVATANVPVNSVFNPFKAKGGFVDTTLPIVAGYTRAFLTQPGQDAVIQIKKS